MNTTETLNAVHKSFKSERRLDINPGEYRMQTIGTDMSFGVGDALRQVYKEMLGTECGRIVTDSTEIHTSPEVIAILRALLYVGCCRNELRSEACRKVFQRACIVGDYVGSRELIATFEEDDSNPFVPVIQDAIKELLGVCNG